MLLCREHRCQTRRGLWKLETNTELQLGRPSKSPWSPFTTKWKRNPKTLSLLSYAPQRRKLYRGWVNFDSLVGKALLELHEDRGNRGEPQALVTPGQGKRRTDACWHCRLPHPPELDVSYVLSDCTIHQDCMEYMQSHWEKYRTKS